MSKHSYVYLEPAHAADLARAKLEDIRRRRAEDVRRHVRQRTEELNASVLRRLFRMAPLTVEEVEAMERSIPDLWANTIWEIENWNYSESQQLCEHIIVSVAYSQGLSPIQLSLHDARTLGATI